jgi:hypothetical protein
MFRTAAPVLLAQRVELEHERPHGRRSTARDLELGGWRFRVEGDEALVVRSGELLTDQDGGQIQKYRVHQKRFAAYDAPDVT